MTFVIGITGGIGSGKSTFSKKLIEKGYRVHDSDKEVQFIYKNPTKDFIKLLNKIGLAKSINKKNINKKIIAKNIFQNPETKQKLERYIFNIVREKRSRFIKSEKKKKTNKIFIDVPLLFENNLDNIFDEIVCIIASRNKRYERLKAKKRITKNLFKNILKSQTSDRVRKERADRIIYNNSTKKSYLSKINMFIRGL